jgi:sugar O-acyltransferase (sialic acid O-acetyltransferase NeuD family)
MRSDNDPGRREAAADRPIVVYGTKGFAREVQQIIDDLGGGSHPLKCVGFLVDPEYRDASVVHGLPVFGDAGWLDDNPGLLVAIGIGATEARQRIVRRIGAGAISRFATLIHPRAYIGDSVEMGTGCIVNVGACATVDIVIGDHVQLHACCTVGHDARIGDFATIAPGARITGRVRIGEGVFIGAGAAVLPDVEVGPWSTIGAGAVVTRDVPANATVAGVPAKVIGQRDAGWHIKSD